MEFRHETYNYDKSKSDLREMKLQLLHFLVMERRNTHFSLKTSVMGWYCVYFHLSKRKKNKGNERNKSTPSHRVILFLPWTMAISSVLYKCFRASFQHGLLKPAPLICKARTHLNHEHKVYLFTNAEIYLKFRCSPYT